MSSRDRPGAIRLALRDLVAERGFHGASMGAVATRAGVAAGTAYVHYASKEEVVFATYLEIKRELGAAAANGYDEASPHRDRWHHVLSASYAHLTESPERARFLTQLEESPYHEEAYSRLVTAGDALGAIAQEFDDFFVDLPYDVIYSLSLGVVVRLVASGISLGPDELDQLIESTWRAVTRPQTD